MLVRFYWNLNFHERFFKKSNIEFHENPSSRNRAVPPGQTATTQLIEVFAILRTGLECGLCMFSN